MPELSKDNKTLVARWESRSGKKWIEVEDMGDGRYRTTSHWCQPHKGFIFSGDNARDKAIESAQRMITNESVKMNMTFIAS